MSISLEEAIPLCISNIEMKDDNDSTIMISATCIFPESFIGFAGHFPGNPVLPAIVQLAAVRIIAEQSIKIPLTLNKYSRAKFRAMVQPNEEIIVGLTINRKEERYQGKFKIEGGTRQPIAEGLFLFNT